MTTTTTTTATAAPAPPRPARMPLLTRAQSRAVDKALINAGVPGVLLMENAGRGAAEAILGLARARGISRATVLVGPGNNGGDGLVVARHLTLAGLHVRVFSLADPAARRGDDAIMRDAWHAVGGLQVVLPQALESGDSGWETIEADLLIDALFGTGLSRPLDGLARAVVRHANARRDRPLSVALDVPSGLDADTGAPLGREDGVFCAQLTLTFGTSKPGLHTGFGRRVSGVVRPIDLGAPLPRVVSEASSFLVRAAPVAPRRGDVHKGDNGRALVVGGSAGTTGAAVLAARAAHRAGAGLVTIASRAAASIDSKVVETMSLALSEDPLEASAQLERALGRYDAVLLGPGLGRDEWALSVLDAVAARARALVLDADALTLAGERGSLPSGKGATLRVLTPHPLEMARLLGHADADKVNADRLRAARECAARYDAVVVLKGAGSVVALPDGRAYVVDCAEPALAIAGSGDVLGGAVVARLAERSDAVAPVDAVLQAVVAHARAGEQVHRDRGTSRGALATEIADALGACLETG